MKFHAVSAFVEIYRQLDGALRARFIRVLLLSTTLSLLELAITAALSLLGLALASPETLINHPATLGILGAFPALSPLVEDQRMLLGVLMAGLCLALALRSLSMAFLTWRQSAFSQTIGWYFSTRFYGMLLRAPYLWHVRQDLSMLQTRLMWARFSADYLLAAIKALGQLFISCVLVAVVWMLSPWAAVLVCACTGVSAAISYHFAQSKVAELNEKSMDTEAAANRVAYPSLAGIREVKICGQAKAFLDQFSAERRKFSDAQTLLPVLYPAPSWFLDFVGMLMLLAALLVLCSQGLSVAQLTGSLALLAAVSWRLLPAVNLLVSDLLQVNQHMLYTLDAVRFIKDLENEQKEQSLKELEEEPGPFALQKGLSLEEVAFRYPDTPADRADALHGLNVKIPKGSMVGFIGSSGAGKSTVVGLLTGLLAPTSGKILVDGRQLDFELRESWIRSLGYVPQLPFLLNDTIAKNVAFSQWGKEIDMKRVEECCRMAAMDFLPGLPDGLSTIIGERGVRLSGGQVQRVAIARALYANPQLILFDEATSALDGASEQAIQQTIESLGQKVTLVLVAHRLSTVKNCDYLYWLGDGTVLMEGTPAKVLPAYEAFLEGRAKELAGGDGCQKRNP